MEQGVDLESQVEQFMKRQAELESGAAFARSRDPEAIIGGDEVNEEVAKGMCADIFEVLRTLKLSRDMSVAEIKLIVSIEDPRTRERRAKAGVEDSRGVSRDEMACALVEVAEGRVPKDRIALRCLHEEVTEWPFLEQNFPGDKDNLPSKADRPTTPKATAPSEYANVLKNADTVVKPYIMGTEARQGDKPQDITDMMPPWVGYGALYGISFIPVMLVIMTVLVLFYNSLK